MTSMYRPKFARTIAYMLQAGEYQARPYLRWLWSVNNFGKVMHRRELTRSRPARLLLTTLKIGMLLEVVAAVILIWMSLQHRSPVWLGLSIAFLLATPIIWAHLIVLPLALGRWLLVKPAQAFHVHRSAKTYTHHPAIKIAIAGSYGKTTMKEILLTVLAEGKKVAATPANRNVLISHAQFAASLKGDEEVLIIEYGEGAPGDVARFSRITKPNLGIITGLAPAHLDKYKTLQAAGQDIFVLADYLQDKNVYVNGDSNNVQPFVKKSHILYTRQGLDGWKVDGVRSGIEGLRFKLTNGAVNLNLESNLIGRHLLAPLALAAALAHGLGLSSNQIENGVARVKPFEHRMQPYQLNGAWVIDDTYNGNTEGVHAGLQLLAELPAKRKIYITPGLVDQGKESAAIHHEVGGAIAKANPDIVVLMKHSTTDDIAQGLKDGGYKGRLIIEDDPLNFYTNLDKFVAAGDLVLMQNDWPDNYV